MNLRKIRQLVLSLCAFAAPIQGIAQDLDGQTLNTVLKRGYLICGVSQGLTGFSTIDNEGQWFGLDVDFCRAVAAATLGDAKRVKFIPLSAKERFVALQSGDIDLLSRNTSWNYLRDVTLDLNFIGVLFYDAQGFMVRTKDKVEKLADLDTATICTNSGTTTEINIADYFKAHQLTYHILTFEKTDETLAAFAAGRCDAYSTDHSGLAAQLLKFPNPQDYRILSETISREPLSPMVREHDTQWEKIIRWVLYTLINAEEMGINQANVSEKLNDKNLAVQRFLGTRDQFGEKIGLKADWTFQVIKQVGNYADVFERNVGQASPLKMDRGLNALWLHHGLMYAPPYR